MKNLEVINNLTLLEGKASFYACNMIVELDKPAAT